MKLLDCSIRHRRSTQLRYLVTLYLVFLPCLTTADPNIMDLFFSDLQQQQIAKIKQLRSQPKPNTTQDKSLGSSEKTSVTWIKIGGITKTSFGYQVWLGDRFCEEGEQWAGLEIMEVSPQVVRLKLPEDSREKKASESLQQTDSIQVIARPGEFVNRVTGELYKGIKPPTSIITKRLEQNDPAAPSGGQLAATNDSNVYFTHDE